MKRKSLVSWMVAAFSAALLLGAVASASASAEACTKKAGSKHIALCIEGQKNEESIPLSIKQASPTGTLVLPKAWPSMEWVCNKIKVGEESAHLTSVAIEGGKTLEVRFDPAWSECTTKYSPTGSKKCAMPKEREFREQPGKFQNSAGKILMSSTAFLEFELTNKSETEICETIRGWHTVHGIYECKLHEPEAETAQHELACESQGNETLIGEKATWLKYAVKVELGGKYWGQGAKFSIYEY